MKNRVTPRERIMGAMIGLAIGDALGAPVEYMDDQMIATEFPSGISGYVNRPKSGLRPGQGTDDTEMAFLTASSLIAKQGLDMDDLVAGLIAWGQGYPSLGPSTGASITAMAAGTPWHEAGQTAVASSGCLPRCLPVALIAPDSSVVAETIRCCKPTHRHPLALAATVVLNQVLERLIRELEWEEAISLLTDSMAYPSGAMAKIRCAFDGELSEPGAVDVLVEALRCVDAAPDAESAVILSVVQGGDTDTRGAVTGALAGARWGISAFPQHWIDGCDASDTALSLGRSLSAVRLAVDGRGT